MHVSHKKKLYWIELTPCKFVCHFLLIYLQQIIFWYSPFLFDLLYYLFLCVFLRSHCVKKCGVLKLFWHHLQSLDHGPPLVVASSHDFVELAPWEATCRISPQTTSHHVIPFACKTPGLVSPAWSPLPEHQTLLLARWRQRSNQSTPLALDWAYRRLLSLRTWRNRIYSGRTTHWGQAWGQNKLQACFCTDRVCSSSQRRYSDRLGTVKLSHRTFASLLQSS